MIILTTTTDLQSFQIITRYYIDSITVQITDENTNEMTEYSDVATTYLSGWTKFDLGVELVEGRFYTIQLINIDDLIYRGRIFCTDQTDYQKYDMNQDGYSTSNDVSDEIIII